MPDMPGRPDRPAPHPGAHLHPRECLFDTAKSFAASEARGAVDQDSQTLADLALILNYHDQNVALRNSLRHLFSVSADGQACAPFYAL